MHRNRLLTTILMMAALAFPAVPAFAAGEVTTGDFLQALARAKHLPAGDAATAARSLRAAGCAIPQVDPSALLTEKSVVDIARSLRLNVTTSSPGSPFTSAQADAFLATFAAELGAGHPEDGRENANIEDELRRGRSHKKGRVRSRCDPI